jgi:hypothetical protein
MTVRFDWHRVITRPGTRRARASGVHASAASSAPRDGDRAVRSAPGEPRPGTGRTWHRATRRESTANVGVGDTVAIPTDRAGAERRCVVLEVLADYGPLRYRVQWQDSGEEGLLLHDDEQFVVVRPRSS